MHLIVATGRIQIWSVLPSRRLCRFVHQEGKIVIKLGGRFGPFSGSPVNVWKALEFATCGRVLRIVVAPNAAGRFDVIK